MVGIGKDSMFVASEFTAFCRHTNQYISLNDKEVTTLEICVIHNISRCLVLPGLLFVDASGCFHVG